MKYTVTTEVEATQWFKNGDHPKDGSDGEGKVVRYFRHPNIPGEATDAVCGHRFHDHGFIDNEYEFLVCPGDWIVTGATGLYFPIKPEKFEATYKPAPDYNEHPPLT